MAAQSNIDIIQRFQSKVLRIITNASKYISNIRIHNDLGVDYLVVQSSNYSSNYRQRLQNPSNPLVISLAPNNIRRLRTPHTNDLPERFQ